METRSFGATGLRVSALGFGAGHVGGDDLTEDEAGSLLNRVVDRGLTLVDTARSYGKSEERIGRHLSWRRGDFVLSTKGGYGIDGVADWTYDAVARGIDESLARLRTDVIDVYHLHSCDRATLERGDVLRALEDAKRAGKIRVAAYSGENEALDYAVDCGAFGSIQCSVNLFDQRALDGAIARAYERDMGVIAKRAIGNAPWRFKERPVGEYCEAYWERMQALTPDPTIGGEWNEERWKPAAISFSVWAPGVDCAIVGSRRYEHVADLARFIEGADRAGAGHVIDHFRAAFRAHDRGWIGQV